MLNEFPAYIEGRSGNSHWPLHSILAIEAEAAPAPDALDDLREQLRYLHLALVDAHEHSAAFIQQAFEDAPKHAALVAKERRLAAASGDEK